MIALNSDHNAAKAGTIVTLLNYEKYQGDREGEDGAANQSSTEGPTALQPVANQSSTTREEDKELKEDKKEGGAAPYAWAGKVIRLTKADYDKWRENYKLPNLDALLQQRDDWLAGQAGADQKKWFVTTSNWLAGKTAAAVTSEGEPVRGAIGAI